MFRRTDTDEATGVVHGLLCNGDQEGVENVEQGEAQGEHRARVHVSPVVATLTLIMSVVGTGMLSLPSTFKCFGVGVGLGLLVAVGLCMFFTGELMLRAHLINGDSDGDTFESLAEKSCAAMKNSWVKRNTRLFQNICSIVNALGLFGGCCAYIAIAKDIFPALKTRVTNGADVNAWYLGTEFGTAFLVVLVSLPLCLLKNIQSLKYSSLLGFFFSIFVVLAVSVRAAEHIAWGWQEWGHGQRMCPEQSWLNSFVVGISVFNFSFVFHFNIVPIFRSLPKEKQTQATMRKVIGATVCASTVLYGMIGAAGFALYGAKVKENILDNFNPFDDDINAARLAIMVCCYLCLPLIMTPLRGSILCLLRIEETTPVRIVVTILLLGLQYAIAILVPSIKVVFSVTGGGAVVGFCFVFPICFALALLTRRNEPQSSPDHQPDPSPLIEPVFDNIDLHKKYQLSRLEQVVAIAMLIFFPAAGAASIFYSLRSSL